MTLSNTTALAVGQFAPTADTAANLAIIAELVADASARGAQLLVLPEYASWFIDPFDDSLAALSAIIALAPVALHRVLFQRRAKPRVVEYGHAALITSLLTVAVLLIGVVAFVFDVVVDGTASWAAVVALSVVLVILWIIAPLVIRARHSLKERR